MLRRIPPSLVVVLALVSGMSIGLALASCGDDDGSGGLCSTGQRVCAGTCHDVSTDNAHCGACDNACTGNKQCLGGTCGCRQPLFICGDSCADIEGDPANCGGCGVVCSGPPECPGDGVCAEGECRPACVGGGCRCNGICTNMQTDARHCGECGNRCPGMQVCQAGVCIDRGSDVDAGPVEDAGPTEDTGPAEDAGPAPDEDGGTSGGA